MCQDDLLSLPRLYREWRVWWRLPLAMGLVLSVALVQHVMVIGVERIEPRLLLIPAFVGGAFGLLWSVMAAYRSQLQRRVELMRHLAEDASDVLILRCRTRFLFLSPRIQDLTGYDPEVFQMTPAFFEELVHESDRPQWQAHQQRLWDGAPNQIQRLTFRLVTTLRGEVWVEHEASCFDFAGERMCRCVLRDVTEAVRLKASLRRLAEQDTLTGLPNRSALVARCLELAVPVHLTCVMVDVADLRQVNVRFGIDVGDFVLRTVAERLEKLWQRSDAPSLRMVSRLVGDNFALVFEAPRSEVEAWLSERMRELIQPVFSEKLHLFIELHLVFGYHEAHLTEPLTPARVEQILRAAYLQVHPVTSV